MTKYALGHYLRQNQHDLEFLARRNGNVTPDGPPDLRAVPMVDGPRIVTPLDLLHARTGFTAAELQGMTFPDPKWAVPGLIAEGANVLAGSPKIGKSWLALNLAVAVASGGKALGAVDVDPGEVLYLALEDGARRLQERMRIVMAGDDWPTRLHFRTTCEPFPAGAEMVGAWLSAYPSARLVIFDVFTRFRGRTNDRASQYAQDYDAMAEIKAVVDAHAVAGLVVHHTRKAASEDFLDSVSGTQGLAGAADAVLILKRSRGNASATLEVTGRDIEEANHALDYDAAIGTWSLLDGPASDYELSEQRRSILEAVRECEGIGPKQIAEASGVTHDVVKQLVRKMVDAGDLDTDGTGRYFPVHRSLRSPFTIPSERSEHSEGGTDAA